MMKLSIEDVTLLRISQSSEKPFPPVGIHEGVYKRPFVRIHPGIRSDACGTI
jgi:hypothetical protein